MALQEIYIPDSFELGSQGQVVEQLIDQANEVIERFMLADQEVIEKFVTCDLHLTQSAFAWIVENHLLIGERVCGLGSGFGVVVMLAAGLGLESLLIEIAQVLVDQEIGLADQLGNDAKFFCGSFIPRETLDDLDVDRDIRNVTIEEDEVYREVGLGMDDFDLFCAFPWPGEQIVF